MHFISIVVTGSGSHVFALIAIIISIISILFTFFWNLRIERRGYLDNYWFREVVAPSFVKPSIELRPKLRSNLLKLSNKCISGSEFMNLQQRLQNDIDEIVQGAWAARMFKGKLYKEITMSLESVVDDVTNMLIPFVINSCPVSSEEVNESVERISDLLLHVLKSAAKANGGSLKVG